MSEPTLDDHFPEGIPEGIKTVCRDCIFADYLGNEQQDCRWGRLEGFEDNGGEVVGIDDSEKRYFTVFGRFCNAYRDHRWGEQHPQAEWANIVAEEFRLRCSLMVYADEESTAEDIRESLKSALEQTSPPAGARRTSGLQPDVGGVPPWSIVLILNRPGDPREFVRMVREMEPKMPWEVRQVTPEEDGIQPPYGRAIDLAVSGLKGATFYGVARAGYLWEPDYLARINAAINYDMKRVVALLPDWEGDGLFMDVRLHDGLLKGHKGGDVLDKLAEVAEEEGTGHMVSTFEELCESA